MERILSENEKIRRAEEIYYRRNNKNINLRGEKENISSSKKYFGSKIILNFLILFNIAIILYAIQNRNVIFKDEFLEKCSKYNVNITNSITGFVSDFLNKNSEVIINENVVNEVQNQELEETPNSEESKVEETKVENAENQMSAINQMDLDVENLKKSYSFKSPIKGIISSGFGARESEYQNVTGYHTGTDIAADKGTNITAAMEGIVTLVSNEGDYRETYKNKM